MRERANPLGPAEFYRISFLYRQEPELDAKALVRRLNPELKTELISAVDSIIGIAHLDYPVQMKDAKVPSITQLVRDSAPLDLGEFAPAIEQTWDWDQVQGVVDGCKHRVRMGDLIGSALPYKDRFAIVHAVANEWSELTHPAAVHWEVAGCLVEPARLKERLSRRCNVRMQRVEDSEGRMLLDTLGMVALGLPDLQVDFIDLEPETVAGWLYALAAYVYEMGNVIKTGNTVDGAVRSERWRCQHSFSLVPPRRHVLDIHAGAHSGFKADEY